jgi:hypothetical protein
MTGLKFWRGWKKAPALYRTGFRWLDWKQGYSREAVDVVKGTNRRVIVVKSPDPKVFEEAIFVVREDFLRHRSPEQVMAEARQAAGDYLKNTVDSGKRRRSRFWGTALGLAGAAGICIAWLVLRGMTI